MSPTNIAARRQRAIELHGQGCNCAQSVALALSDLIGMDEDDLFRVMEGFGGGMGGFSETCGAISGGVAVIGLKTSAGVDVKKSKGATYKVARRLARSFREANGSTLCSDLKGLTTADRTPLRSCDGCIEDAVELTCRLLAELDADTESNQGSKDQAHETAL